MDSVQLAVDCHLPLFVEGDQGRRFDEDQDVHVLGGGLVKGEDQLHGSRLQGRFEPVRLGKKREESGAAPGFWQY